MDSPGAVPAVLRPLRLDTVGQFPMREENHERLLLEAAEAGDLQQAREIVRARAGSVNLNCRDEAGDTPLILAARGGHEELARFLLSAGAEMDAANRDGDNALIAASQRPGNTAVLKLLMGRGAGIDGRNLSGRTALIAAASAGDLRNVLLLLQHGPELNVVTKEEETALTFAVVYEHPDVVKALI